MTCLTRSIFRWGLIGALVLGGAAIIWPDHVKAGFAQVRSKVQSIADRNSEDPMALRRQLASLAEQYPERIAEVRGELAQVDRHIFEHERDIEIARRVVAMTTDDLGRLKELVTRAESEAEKDVRPVSLRFEGVRFNIDQAYTEARRIHNVRTNYQDRLAHDEQQLTFLLEQKSRLAAILEQLESEYAAFETQLAQLDRQINAIERNDRLIQLTEQQQATLAEYERFGKVGNLKQLEGKLAHLRAIQEAQLKTLEQRGMSRDYEGRARYEIDIREDNGTDPFRNIEPSSGREQPSGSRDGRAGRSMVWADPVIVE